VLCSGTSLQSKTTECRGGLKLGFAMHLVVLELNLHSSSEMGDLSLWLFCVGSTMYIGVDIIVIIFYYSMIVTNPVPCFCVVSLHPCSASWLEEQRRACRNTVCAIWKCFLGLFCYCRWTHINVETDQMDVLVQVKNCEDFFQTKPVLHPDA